MTDHLQEEEFQGNLNLRLWLRLFTYALAYKKFLVPMVLAAIGTAGCDALFTLLMRQVIDDVTAHGARTSLMPYALAYAGLVTVMSGCIWSFIKLGGRISTGVAHDIRRESFAKLQELSFSYYDRRPVGWLMSRLTSDCDRLARLMGWGLLDIVWGFTFLVAVSIIMFAINWKLALAVFVVIPPLGYVSKVFQKQMLLTSRAARRINSLITAAYNEGLMGVRTTKTLVREEQNLAEFKDLTRQMYGASVKNALQSALFWPTVTLFGAVGAGLAMWVGGLDAMAGSITLGTLILFISYAQRFFDPIQELARVMTEVLGAQAAAERVQGLLDTESEVKDSPEVVRLVEERRAQDPVAGLAPDGLPDRIGEIEFRNVAFAYKEGQAVLDGFNLKIAGDRTVAFVGPTGGGKTTIVSLLARFYEPTGGEILLDGVDYRNRPLRWLQSKLGIVLQTPHLFNGTVRENIAYGNLAANEDLVYRAAKLANAHDFILKMEKGYDTPLGPGGNRLSTGQKQLVSLARAILADPRVFIMDEATSSVDTETERLIQHGIETVLKGRVSFVIAHRLSTIRSADRILVIEKGRIVEDGTHPELIRARGKYHKLYTSQFTREMEEEALRREARPPQA